MKRDIRFRAIMEKAWMRYATEFNVAKHYAIISESPTAPANERLADQEDVPEPEEAVYSLVGDDDDI